jgi:hypothetical protein
MSENIKVRPIPKKTFILMGIIILLAIGIFSIKENKREVKARYILTNLGYKNISNLNVYSEQKVENRDTKIQGFKYYIKFTNDKNEFCTGYILRNFKEEMAQDIKCTKK